MKLKEKLELLLSYYKFTRRAGHTRLLKEGIKNYEGEKLIVSHSREDHRILECKSSEIISTRFDGLKSLIGNKKAVAIDNNAIYSLLSETLEYISKLENELEKSRHKLKIVKSS